MLAACWFFLDFLVGATLTTSSERPFWRAVVPLILLLRSKLNKEWGGAPEEVETTVSSCWLGKDLVSWISRALQHGALNQFDAGTGASRFGRESRNHILRSTVRNHTPVFRSLSRLDRISCQYACRFYCSPFGRCTEPSSCGPQNEGTSIRFGTDTTQRRLALLRSSPEKPKALTPGSRDGSSN